MEIGYHICLKISSLNLDPVTSLAVTPPVSTPGGRRFDPGEILKATEAPGEGPEGGLGIKQSVILKSKRRGSVLMAIKGE
jgi:hypothetical protein